MKLLILILSLFSFSVQALAKEPAKPFINPGPDGVRFNKLETYRVMNLIERKLREKDLSPLELVENENLKTILTTGKRAVTWFAFINEKRSDGNKLDLNGKLDSKGMPITAPMKTNSVILWNRYQDLLKSSSPAVVAVITGTDELPSNPPVSDEEFINAIKKFDVLYQHTIRWSGSKESLPWFINRSLWDIRGYYFLKNLPDLFEKFEKYTELPLDEQKQLSSWLFGLCHNGDFEDSDCKDELKNAITKGRLKDYYSRFNRYGESQYKSFFRVPAVREEAYWNKDQTILISPFLTPQRFDVLNWLKTNIEEEWQGTGFQLKLSFQDSSPKPIPHIEFQSGVTANVNVIAGDTITMDGDYSINNYAQRWTIRHEYGHVLGLVDCYLEFYDVNEKAMIYYEIDIDNLMCSRHGSLKPIHIESLKEAYKK